MSQKTEKLLERYCLLILWLSLFPSASCPSSPTQIIWCLGLIVLWRPAPPSIWMLQFTATSSYSPHRLAALGAAWLLLPHPEALEGESCLPDRQHAPWSGAATVYRYDVLEMGLPWMGRAFSASAWFGLSITLKVISSVWPFQLGGAREIWGHSTSLSPFPQCQPTFAETVFYDFSSFHNYLLGSAGQGRYGLPRKVYFSMNKRAAAWVMGRNPVWVLVTFFFLVLSWSLCSIKQRRPIMLQVKCDVKKWTGYHFFGSSYSCVCS